MGKLVLLLGENPLMLDLLLKQLMHVHLHLYRMWSMLLQAHVVERNIVAHHLMTVFLLSKGPMVKSSICTTLLYGQLLLVLAPAQRLQKEGRQARKARKAGKAANPPNALKEKTNCNMS